MRKIIFSITLVMVFGIAVLAEATLFDRDGGLIYCDTLDITLLQNANYAGTTMFWDEAVSWAENLEYYDSVRDVTWDDWRLPNTVDGPLVYGYEGDPDENGEYSYTYGYNLANSEMGHLFYTELTNKGYVGTDGEEPQPSWGLSNTGDFINLQDYHYWSGSDYTSAYNGAWSFNFGTGRQSGYTFYNDYYAWAVRPGDVGAAPVPEPGTMFLMVMGLLGIVGLSKFGQRHG